MVDQPGEPSFVSADTHGRQTLYPEGPANLGHTTAVRPRHAHMTFDVQTAPLAGRGAPNTAAI